MGLGLSHDRGQIWF